MADNPQHHIPEVGWLGSMIIWVCVSLFGASLTVLKKSIRMIDAAFYLALASFVGPSLCFLLFSFWPTAPWYIGIPICACCSLSIVGVALLLDKFSDRVGKTDPIELIPKPYRPTLPPKEGGDNVS